MIEIASLRLTEQQRQSLIKKEFWSIQEASFYFCDCDFTEKLEEIGDMSFLDHITEIREVIINDFSKNRRLYRKYQISENDFNQAITTKIDLVDLMLWVKQKWKKYFIYQERPILFDRYKKEIGFPSRLKNMSKKDQKNEQSDAHEKAIKPLTLSEKEIKQAEFLLSKGIRIDYFIQIAYEAYYLAWYDDLNPPDFSKPIFRDSKQLSDFFDKKLPNAIFEEDGKFFGLKHNRLREFLSSLVRTEEFSTYKKFTKNFPLGKIDKK